MYLRHPQNAISRLLDLFIRNCEIGWHQKRKLVFIKTNAANQLGKSLDMDFNEENQDFDEC